MASIQADDGDYFGSQESVTNSLKYLNERIIDSSCLSSDYNELALSSDKLKNYDFALKYYDSAMKFQMNQTRMATLLNNKAVIYQKKKDFDKAIEIFDLAIEKAEKNSVDYARVMSNLAKTRWLQNSNFNAIPDLFTALQIREKNNHLNGIITSYDHISDYYFNSRPDSALIYATKMYDAAAIVNNPEDKLDALQKLIKLSPERSSKEYFENYEYLNDSLQTARNAAKNQFAFYRYDSEKSKADNLVLQKDNSDKRIQIFKQRLIFYGTLIVVIVLAIIAFRWYRKRRQKMLLESETKIRDQQLKTSQRVHDIVANGIYSIITTVEHRTTIEKDSLLDDLEILYEKSRNISYEQPEDIRTDFEEAINKLVNSFATSTTKVLVSGNNQNLWSLVNEKSKKQIEYVLQELMINMKKHSQAQNVVVKFEQNENSVNLQYTDDGIGVPSSFSFGNGLRNTENRIKSIGGEIIFDRSLRKGLRVLISFPIAN